MEELNYFGEKFEYFGFRYCIANDDKSVALKQVPYAKGKIFIPKEVEYNNKKYPVIQIGGFTLSVQRMTDGVIETDRRKKNYWREKPHWVFDHEEFVSPFPENNGYASDFDRQIVPNSTIASVILPDSIRFLGNSAFRRCYALEEVNLPKGITVIPVRSFSGCIALKSIQLHEGITEIGDMAFFGCTAMKEITIPSTVTKIGEDAFGDSEQNKSGLEVVNILNEEGALLMYPNSFTDRIKINYLGKNGANKIAKEKSEKNTPSTKNTSIDLEKLIQAALVDGVVTDKERAILVKKMKEAGGDVDEFEMLLDARIYEAQQKNGKAKSEPKPAPKPAAKPAAKVSGDFKKSAVSGDYTIGITPDNKVVVSKGGKVCDNAKGALREISEKVGFKFETSWTTQQFGSKLVDFLNSK